MLYLLNLWNWTALVFSKMNRTLIINENVVQNKYTNVCTHKNLSFITTYNLIAAIQMCERIQF